MLRMFCLMLLLASPLASATPVWFVFGEIAPTSGDSFIVPMTRATDIAEARRQVAEGRQAGRGAPVVRIAAGSDGINRDVADGQPWSWHVTEFLGYADAFVTTCQATPQGIEWDPATFIANAQGEACFLAYTTIAELPGSEHVIGTSDPVAPALAISNAMDGAWFDPAMPGQGVFIDVLPDTRQLALGWFAFQPGAAGTQRWWTGLGSYQGLRAGLTLFLSSNGAFAAADPVNTEEAGVGELGFLDCNHASLVYVFADGVSGIMPLQRVVPIAHCDGP